MKLDLCIDGFLQTIHLNFTNSSDELQNYLDLNITYNYKKYY